MFEKIESVQNTKIKNVAKLQTRKERKKTGEFLVEGHHLVEEAVKSELEVVSIFAVDAEHITEAMQDKTDNIYLITFKVAEKLSQTESPQGIYAVCKMPEQNLETVKKAIYLDRVQDPGNVGTIIRTADAAGMDAVIISKGTVDVYNDKVLRSSQGSSFHLPVIEADFDEIKGKFAGAIYGTSLDGKDYRTVQPADSYMLVLGNEGQGVDEKILNAADNNLYVPILGQAESLNVAVCAGILMYHLQS